MSMPNKLFPGLGNQSQSEVQVKLDQAMALKSVFENNPATVAARNVLHSQLLSSGLLLKQNGESIDVAPLFRRHLDSYWTSFARDVLDAFLIYGFCVVTYDTKDTNSSTTPLRLRKKRQRQEGSKPGTSDVYNTIPSVAPIGSFRLAFKTSGKSGMRREYTVYKQASDGDFGRDDESIVFLHNEPDSQGNICSALASVRETAQFMSNVISLAVDAERILCNPPLVTQTRPKVSKPGANPGDMYFDSESREIQSESQQEENAQSARALQLQIDLCRAINSAQNLSTPNSIHQTLTSAIHGNGEVARQLGERMYALPVNQEIARVEQPHARTDLVNIVRMANDMMSTAIGVPSSLLFEARFSGQSSSQLALLNSTVQQLGRAVDGVLTNAYNDIYYDADVDGIDSSKSQSGRGNGGSSSQLDLEIELVTTTAPIAVSSEVANLYQIGLADFQSAAPLALHAVGMSATDIQAAIDREEDKQRDMVKLGMTTQAGVVLPPKDDTSNQGAPGASNASSKSKESASSNEVKTS